MRAMVSFASLGCGTQPLIVPFAKTGDSLFDLSTSCMRIRVLFWLSLRLRVVPVKLGLDAITVERRNVMLASSRQGQVMAA